MRRSAKQFFISLILLAIVCAVVFLAYFFFFSPAPPLCEDCDTKDLEKLKLELLTPVKTGDNRYDLVARIRNPNQTNGAKKIEYSFKIYGGDDMNPIEEVVGTSYILANQAKYIIEPNVEVPASPASGAASPGNIKIKFSVSQVEWRKMEGDIPVFALFHPAYSSLKNEQGGFASFTGTLVNKTSSLYKLVRVVVVLFDSNNSIISTNLANVENVSPNKDYDFNIIWSEPFLGIMARYDVEAYANPF